MDMRSSHDTTSMGVATSVVTSSQSHGVSVSTFCGPETAEPLGKDRDRTLCISSSPIQQCALFGDHNLKTRTG